MILDDIYSWLSGVTALTAICADRIYPVNLPQGVEFPCVRFERDEDGGFKDFDGQGETIRTDIVFDFIAESLSEATNMADAVRADLKNLTGAFGTRYVQRVSLEAELDQYDFKIAEGKYRSSQAWTMWHV